MDVKIEKNIYTRYRKLVFAIIFFLILSSIYVGLRPSSESFLSIHSNSIKLGKATLGIFDDSIRIRGQVEPLTTLFIDTESGGRVEEIYIEEGNLVEEGQLVVKLSNPSVQLSVIRGDADTIQQLNNIRSLELNLEQNKQRHKRELIDLDYQIALQKKRLFRAKHSVKTGGVSRSELEDIEIEYNWYVKRKNLAIESQKTDILMQEQQILQMRSSARQLEQNLEITRKSLESLNVIAPATGKLTSFNLKVGQSIKAGERIAQIDDYNQFKVKALLDEFYLDRVEIGQSAIFDKLKDKGAMEIIKIYPQVEEGKFEVDFELNVSIGTNMKRGQTLQGALQLGGNSESLLIPNGAFYQSGGGNSVYLISEDGTEAKKVPVTLGRRNSKYIEVIEGLNQGNELIISSYSRYNDIELLKIN
ncbi:efflux RND transporter periplasmic adaptor subunit [Microbulbifer epialgicus]|uniref:Efflux RND transporter periplasmic adaptor subunit n=1 Tax=Microbulbifer epialgicus TaxID=393907 RepID=A0ABV4P4J0_9GAMM